MVLSCYIFVDFVAVLVVVLVATFDKDTFFLYIRKLILLVPSGKEHTNLLHC